MGSTLHPRANFRLPNILHVDTVLPYPVFVLLGKEYHQICTSVTSFGNPATESPLRPKNI